MCKRNDPNAQVAARSYSTRATCRPPIACAQAAYRSRADSRAARRPCPRWKRPVPAPCASSSVSVCARARATGSAARGDAAGAALLSLWSVLPTSTRARTHGASCGRGSRGAGIQRRRRLVGLLGATHHIRNHDNHSHFPISYSSGFLSSVAISPTARSLVVCSRIGVLDVCGF